MSALDNLRGVVRIAKAASIGVSGNGPREGGAVVIHWNTELASKATEGR